MGKQTMRIVDGQLTISATDFATHCECTHKTALELKVARKQLTRPPKSEIERIMLEEQRASSPTSSSCQRQTLGMSTLASTTPNTATRCAGKKRSCCNSPPICRLPGMQQPYLARRPRTSPGPILAPSIGTG